MKKEIIIKTDNPYLSAGKKLVKMYPDRAVFFEFLIDALYALNAIHAEYPDRWTKTEKMNRFHIPCEIATTLTRYWTVDGVNGEENLARGLNSLIDEINHNSFQQAVCDLLIACAENLNDSIPTPGYFDSRLEGIKALNVISHAIYDDEVQAAKSRAAA